MTLSGMTGATVADVSALDDAPAPMLTIRPAAGWAALNIEEIWHFRELMMTFAVRDLKLRYRQTALGAAWVVFQPLMAAGILSFVFGMVAGLKGSNGVPYFIFSYAGLLGWNAFNSTFTKSAACLVGNAQLVSKIYFPRIILPLSTAISSLVDFAIALVVILLIMPFFHLIPSWQIVFLPLWFLLITLLAAGLGLYTSALTVSYRDVQYIVPVFMQFLMYASPVAYSVADAMARVPAKYRFVYILNPLTGLLEAMRFSVLGRGDVNWNYVIYSTITALVAFVGSAMAFKRMEQKFADVI
jgi:lipopolysaccharide transport system permease protein